MMHDVQSWILKRTDLAGHARDMLAKAAMAALGGVAEALLVDATSPPMGKRQPTKPRIDALVADDTVTAEAGTDLYWLWDMRNRQHLAGLDASEFDFYPPDAHPRAEAAVGGLIAALQLRAFAPPG